MRFVPLLPILLGCALTLNARAEDVTVFHIGNSVTDAIQYDRLTKVAEGLGDSYVYGRHTIPGAPLSWIYEKPEGGFATEPYGSAPKALPNHEWSVVTLEPFDRQIGGSDGDREMGANFIKLALENPDNKTTRFLLYSRWPRRDSDDAPTFYGKTYQEQWERPYIEPSYDGGNETREFFEQVLEVWREDFPDLTIDIVPVGDVLYELANRIDEGKVKGYKNITDIYSDGIHFYDGSERGNVGSYAVALTFYTTIFKKSPVGDKEFGLWGISDPELAKQIQSLVWEVVAGHPFSGVPGPV